MLFMNNTETIGTIMNTGSTTLTGNLVASILLIMIILIIVALMFGIPLEFTAIIILPFCIVVASQYSNFMIPLITIILFLSAVITKNWLFR